MRTRLWSGALAIVFLVCVVSALLFPEVKAVQAVWFFLSAFAAFAHALVMHLEKRQQKNGRPGERRGQQ